MRITALFCLVVLALSGGVSLAQDRESAGSEGQKADSAAHLLERLQDHYAGRNFSVDFRQESSLEAMDITDEALGRAWFKHPGKMRWEYLEPEKHVIISDGETLWVHRPGDHQVMVGDSAEYFGDGKGASFLADFEVLKELFEVSLEDCGEDYCRLKLIPRKKQVEISAVYLNVDTETLDIKQVDTENVYGDLTRIFFQNMEFDPEMEDGLFDFTIPEGADVIEMGE